MTLVRLLFLESDNLIPLIPVSMILITVILPLLATLLPKIHMKAFLFSRKHPQHRSDRELGILLSSSLHKAGESSLRLQNSFCQELHEHLPWRADNECSTSYKPLHLIHRNWLCATAEKVFYKLMINTKKNRLTTLSATAVIISFFLGR